MGKIKLNFISWVILITLIMSACNPVTQTLPGLPSTQSVSTQSSPNNNPPQVMAQPGTATNVPFPSHPPVITENNLSQLVQVAIWPYSNELVEFSPDGSILVTETLNKLYLWQVSDHQLIHTIDNATNFAFSPDGKFFAALLKPVDETGLALWNTQDWTQIRLSRPHRYTYLPFMGFSADSHFLITSGQLVIGYQPQRAIEMINVTDGNTFTTITDTFLGEFSSLSKDGKTIAMSSGTSLVFFNLGDGKEIGSLSSQKVIESSAFSPDGKTIAIGTDQDVELWRVNDGTKIRTFQDSVGGEYYKVTFIGDSGRVGSSDGSGDYQVWQLNDGALLSKKADTGASNIDINSMFTMDGKVVLWDGFLRRVSDGKMIYNLSGPKSESLDIYRFSPDGRWLAGYLRMDGTITIWANKYSEPTSSALTPAPAPTSEFTATPAATPSLGSILTRDKDGMQMVFVPAGSFTMGSNKSFPDQKPAHKVKLDAYWIDKTEVTTSMYVLCVNAGGCQPPHPDTDTSSLRSYYGKPGFKDYPVYNVDWQQANDYCTWAGGRLPTEAEWEKAGRGTDGRIYPWGNTVDQKYGNFGQEGGQSMPVASYEFGKSPYGAYDMAGNVLEWVADWFDVYPGGNPKASKDFGKTYRVFRGSTAHTYIDYVQISNRHWEKPGYFSQDTGFRCALSATQK